MKPSRSSGSNFAPVIYAFAAAATFGASAPLAKLLLSGIHPILLAGLLYLGSGIGLSAIYVLRRTFSAPRSAPVTIQDLKWLLAASAAGGVAAPIALMTGLKTASGASVSLTLNFESVFTALIAWFAFRENFDKRIAAGMFLIFLGGVVLSVPEEEAKFDPGCLYVVAACLFWGLDNNLTQKVSASDPIAITAFKGLVAGCVNSAIALFAGASFPSAEYVLFAGAVGLIGYGLSLCLFVLALRGLGTARTGAYFALAPFIGAALALPVLNERISSSLAVSAVLMALGVWLHLTEKHDHYHQHKQCEHEHRHFHDEHHLHEHKDGRGMEEPHSHLHEHCAITHSHGHYPDIHHCHDHD